MDHHWYCHTTSLQSWCGALGVLRTLGSLGHRFPANSWAHLNPVCAEVVQDWCLEGEWSAQRLHRLLSMAILGEQVLAFTMPESASVSQARTWLGCTSAAEVNVWHFAPLNGDMFHYPSALCCSESCYSSSCLSREPSGKLFAQSKG